MCVSSDFGASEEGVISYVNQEHCVQSREMEVTHGPGESSSNSIARATHKETDT